MLIVIMLRVDTQSVCMLLMILSFVILSVFTLSVVTLSTFVLSVCRLSAIKLSFLMLSVIVPDGYLRYDLRSTYALAYG